MTKKYTRVLRLSAQNLEQKIQRGSKYQAAPLKMGLLLVQYRLMPVYWILDLSAIQTPSCVCNSSKIRQIKLCFGEREGDRLVLGERVKISQAALYRKLARMIVIPKRFCTSILTGHCLHHSSLLEPFFGVRVSELHRQEEGVHLPPSSPFLQIVPLERFSLSCLALAFLPPPSQRRFLFEVFYLCNITIGITR